MAAHQHHGAEKVTRASVSSAMVDMNMTPMIDVLLVLLVIFMVTIPMTQKGLDVNLPLETQTQTEAVPSVSQIVVNYTADRVLSVNNEVVTIANLEGRLRTIFETRREKTMFIIGAGSLRYGEIVEVIDAATGAGVDKVGIVTDGMRRAAGAATGE